MFTVLAKLTLLAVLSVCVHSLPGPRATQDTSPSQSGNSMIVPWPLPSLSKDSAVKMTGVRGSSPLPNTTH